MSKSSVMPAKWWVADLHVAAFCLCCKVSVRVDQKHLRKGEFSLTQVHQRNIGTYLNMVTPPALGAQ